MLFKFNLIYYLNLIYLININGWILILIFILFLIKLSLFYFHLWLIKVHVEVSIVNSIILSSLILKVGRFVLIRLIFFINLNFINLNLLIFSFRFYGVFLISLLNYLNYDFKLLIAYSSLIYINIIRVLIFSLFKLNIFISIFILIFHRLNSLMIFFGRDFI